MPTKLNFGAQVDSWVRESEQRMLAVFRESTQRTISLAQEAVPVDTGFLRASIQASLSAMPTIAEEKSGGSAKKNAKALAKFDNTVVLTIAGAKLGQTIYVGYTASYAIYVEYGTSKMSPRPYVGLAAAQWSRTVSQVVDELKTRVAAGR